MDFSFDHRTEELRAELGDFMRGHVLPAEHQFHEPRPADAPWQRPAVMAELRAEARKRGLWNLFLPHSPLGAGLSNLQYAPLAELTGHSPQIAPEALNCQPPDTGNMELLAMFATPEQRERWLTPLLNGTIKSAFCMTEPDVASADAANIATRAVREGDDYVIDGRKWWTTGALSPDCRLLLVMAVTAPKAERGKRHSMLLVPADTPGVDVRRGLTVFGYTDGAHGGHAEVGFDAVRVPAANLLGGDGEGFALAQARLGPGRIHHCMRAVGMAERALALMCERVDRRVAFGRPLARQGVIREWIAEARVRIDQLRLLVLHAAWSIDTHGVPASRRQIAAIKVAAPATAEWVLDKAVQAHGAGGMSQDFPLAALWAQARALRFIDGPDEVHKMVLARHELTIQATERDHG
ncbi:MAG: acyl-CoA dehydrogenase [Streptomycetaceae bacterium]|nr:acyl-CoA dehydrogenase [Streptomycetaceae bacterium]